MSLREALPLLEAAPAARMAGRLKEQILRALPPGLAVRAVPHVQYGSICEGARHTAAAVDAALVVVGTDAGAMAALPATMAAAGVPVLVARNATPPPFERVLVPLGAADLEVGSLRYACEWLSPFELIGASVLPEVHVLHASRRLADWRAIGDRFEGEVRAVEEDVRRTAGVFHRHVRWAGAAWPAIVATSRELGADLVVLRPGRGRASEDRTWSAVVGQARTNVLLLPGAAATASPAASVDALEAMVEDSEGVPREPEARDVELEPALA
jgi:hypothetical protein